MSGGLELGAARRQMAVKFGKVGDSAGWRRAEVKFAAGYRQFTPMRTLSWGPTAQLGFFAVLF